MPQKILDALTSLDPEDDSHWTGDGSPRLDVMKELVGKSVTREELGSVAKDFNRKNPVLESQDSNQSDPNGAQDNEGVAAESEDDEKQKAEQELTSANEALKEARQRQSDALAAMDVIIAKESAKSSGISTADDIKAFQKSQQDQRAKQSVNAKELAELISSHKKTA